MFGHNSNVKIGETLYHVQTEDRGTSHAIIDTMVYQSGRVLHRRSKSYGDLLPINAEREETLKQRVSAQHNAVLEELRSGALKLPQHVAPVAAAKPSAHGQQSDGKPSVDAALLAAAASHSLALRLLNASTWLAGKRATLQICVFQKSDGIRIAGAQVTARIEGAAEPAQFSTATGLDGSAQLAFDMPRLAGQECALVIDAAHGRDRASLRFQLRAKPKVPA